MKIQIINTSRHPLPQYATPQSAGVDLRANLNEPIVLKPLQRCLVPTGLFWRCHRGMRLRCVRVVDWLSKRYYRIEFSGNH